MKKATAREVALDILIEYEERHSYSNLLLNHALEKSGLDDRDKRLVTELVYGTIQRMNTLDWILNSLVKKGTGSLEPWVGQLLRLGIYQLAYLDKIPSRAAVHETVQIAKKRGHKGISGLVNGVMRSYLRQKERLTPSAFPKNIKEKALYYSHPEWMVRRMEEVYGEEESRLMFTSNHVPPKVNIRVNSLRLTRDQFIEKWGRQQEGKALPSPVSPDGIRIERGGNPAFSLLFREGDCSIQDESSMLVAPALDPRPGMKVLDVCAAPGGKTMHMAERMKNEGSILACDIHEHKLELISSNANRLGITIVTPKKADGRELGKEIARETFDAILLDAPCSGLGVIRRKPDIKWSKEARMIDPLVQMQKELLEAVAPLLKPGGVLVYSTCTIEPRENQEQVEAFLSRHPEFFADEKWQENLLPLVRERAIIAGGWLQILPHHFMSDGFFIARMIKRPS
ncbi:MULTISPECIES: 16S rRNA (cytosine(967)-C(5))-methyltransferase RsmB [Thermoactinomyces]|jgi:16S rRNA (cytosine967-C5)-methyltransferase|uniref:16S rRNA (cytosine(967)-C(5))-methyltransferase n=1 Tax=Thermoactinomyces daqus TaxID=1329516 RepID=A0A7W1X9K1_9BACL|nr:MULTISPECIES: 16S rRNA (cytosine(967)-C(5))-methyltransferase RsmB [Thermoactinomyces]MBA4542483.1 16S rRNA (cytosine(967)-C(5))-methyltransferase RsmB [Thermoactinomyces daqus]MBH8603148.1 16S rRNA (cytosine(967)-C(5))-methyltransferase RsmB [Thermoactinomyces sp. CICC 10522]MBH8607045.1 16S rRNA (cytosine(967)-C(5))-methyltransferase RsmB [Thermoactinomyces sp. CICC 10521]